MELWPTLGGRIKFETPSGFTPSIFWTSNKGGAADDIVGVTVVVGVGVWELVVTVGVTVVGGVFVNVCDGVNDGVVVIVGVKVGVFVLVGVGVGDPCDGVTVGVTEELGVDVTVGVGVGVLSMKWAISQPSELFTLTCTNGKLVHPSGMST